MKTILSLMFFVGFILAGAEPIDISNQSITPNLIGFALMLTSGLIMNKIFKNETENENK